MCRRHSDANDKACHAGTETAVCEALPIRNRDSVSAWALVLGSFHRLRAFAVLRLVFGQPAVRWESKTLPEVKPAACV